MVLLLVLHNLATQQLTVLSRTETKIEVKYTPQAGEEYNELIARSQKCGRVKGHCDAIHNTCTVEGLSPGEMYELWVRGCIYDPEETYCVLRAQPLKRATKPSCELIKPDRNCINSNFAHLFLFKLPHLSPYQENRQPR